MMLCLAVLGMAWRRLQKDHRQQHLWAALEALGRDLHAWAEGSQHLRTFSASGIGWQVARARPGLLERTADLTAEFRLMLRKLRRRLRSPRPACGED